MVEKKEMDLGMDENSRAAFSYLLGWITGLFFYLTEKKSDYVRFHALQSITTFLMLHIIIILLGAFSFFLPGLWFLRSIFTILMFILWIVLIIKTYQGEKIKLPITGEIAESLLNKSS
ncbi:MAG: DUF4870 domain-containing protein [archaeon]